MHNKKIPYGKQTITEKDIRAVVEVLKSDFITQGPEASKFEQKVAQYHNAKYAVAFCNGTAALHAAYYAAGINEGDEIITSPVTFVASANAAIYCGARPVFVDIDLDTNCIDISRLETKLTNRTKVITPVSLAGYPVDLQAVKEIAEVHNCFVIHDAAHAIGSKRDGSFGMEYADMAILSFHPVKHITCGEGGMVLTNNKALYEKLVMFRTHGITKDPKWLSHNDGPWYYEMQSLGYNYRLSDIHAALGMSQFDRIQDNLKKRNQIAKIYNDSFQSNAALVIPPDCGFEILENDHAGNIHSYHLYTLRIANADKRLDFYTYLHNKGILAQIHYIPLHLQPYYQMNYGYREGDFPNAEQYYRSEVSIPMYHGMEDDDISYVIDKIISYCGQL